MSYFFCLEEEDDYENQNLQHDNNNIIEDVNRVVSVVDKVIKQFECDRDETIEQLQVYSIFKV